jgi:hypothetical protein
MRALWIVPIVVAAFALSGCGKHDVARSCPKGWTCYAPPRASRLPISVYCERLQRQWEQNAEREIQQPGRLKPTLERLIQRTLAMDAVAANTIRANPWHESSAIISAALSQLTIRHDALTALSRELTREGIAPSIALGRLPGADPGCQFGEAVG